MLKLLEHIRVADMLQQMIDDLESNSADVMLYNMEEVINGKKYNIKMRIEEITEPEQGTEEIDYDD